mmetsp:Transcript_11868/g.21475  ORF Transcript_11868/g.21475 Transcript_11868/m.21475 type:complete len:155 (-) Transcript_11868:270-734(-)
MSKKVEIALNANDKREIKRRQLELLEVDEYEEDGENEEEYDPINDTFGMNDDEDEIKGKRSRKKSSVNTSDLKKKKKRTRSSLSTKISPSPSPKSRNSKHKNNVNSNNFNVSERLSKYNTTFDVLMFEETQERKDHSLPTYESISASKSKFPAR